jgi:hypothetical protein
MKKKNLIKRLQLKKTHVSNLAKDQVVGGGSRFQCEPIDLSELETCNPYCNYTDTCTQFNTCNNVSFLNCTVYNCGTGGTDPSGGISCPGYVC